MRKVSSFDGVIKNKPTQMVSIFMGYIVFTMFLFMETWCILFWGLLGFPKIKQLHITYGCSLRLTLEIKSTSIQLVQNPDIIYIAMKYHYITPWISTIQVPYQQSTTWILPWLFNGVYHKIITPFKQLPMFACWMMSSSDSVLLTAHQFDFRTS